MVVHVGKRSNKSFANWFLSADGEKTNLALLRSSWNDSLFRDEICPYLRPKQRSPGSGILGRTWFL